MSTKPQSTLIILLLVLAFLTVDEIGAYEPIVTIGKPSLYDILYSPDGRFLATLTRTYLELLDAETFAPVARVDIADGYRLAFSPDSSLVAIFRYDEDIQIWHVDSETFLATIPVTTKRAEFSPDWKYLAYADGDSVFLWDVEQRKTVRELTGDPQPSWRPENKPYVRIIAFHPDSRILAVGSIRRTIALWDMETGEILSYLEPKFGGYPNLMSFNHDGTLLAATLRHDNRGSETIGLWDVATGDSRYKSGRFASLAFTPDDQHLLVGGSNGNLHVIQVDTFDVEKVPAIDHLPPPNSGGGINRVRRLTFHPDGRGFATLINGSRIRVWDAQNFSRLQTIYGYGYTHLRGEAVYLPEINRIVTGKDTDVLYFWDATTGELLEAFEFYWNVNLLKVAPGRGRIIIDAEGTHQIWDAAAAKPIKILEARNSSWNTRVFEFSPSGKYLASNGWWGTIIWDMKTGKRLIWLDKRGAEIDQLRTGWSDHRLLKFTPDEKQIILIPPEQEKTVFWDIKDGELVGEIEHIGPLVNVNAGLLQARGVNDTIEIRFLQSDRLLSQIPEDISHLDYWRLIPQIQFHPSGNVLAVHHLGDHGEPGECRFYNTWTGELISTIPDIQSLRFAADGSYIFLVDNKEQLGLYRTSDILGKPVSPVFTAHAFDKITTFGQIKQDQLLQNYPNPFNPETWIPYQLETGSVATIAIYDSIGQVVRTLDLGHKKSGYHTAHWNGKDNSGQSVASGIFFYVIRTDNGFSDTRKMALLK